MTIMSVSPSAAVAASKASSTWLQRLLVLLTVFLLYLTGRSLYRLFFAPLARFPGPFWAGITHAWHARLIRSNREPFVLQELHARYGPFVRIGPSQLSVTDPATFRKMYSVTGAWLKADYYEAYRMPHVETDLFVEKNETLHSKFKRQFSNAYSASSVVELDGRIDGTIKKYISHLERRDGTDVELSLSLKRFLLDCFCDFSLERNLGYTGSKQGDALFEEIETWVKWAHLYGWTPALLSASKLSHHIRRTLFPLPQAQPDAIGQLIEETFRDLRDPGKSSWAEKQSNLASKLLRVQDSKGSDALNDSEMAYILDFGVKAGVADGGNWLSGLFYQLIHNPDKLEKLMQELRQRVRDGELDMICTSKQAAACTYLNAAIQESLRLSVCGGGIMPRETPSGGIDLLGQHLPAGITLGSPSYTIQRMPEIFGADPDAFIPERWLETDRPDMSRFSMEFGMGPRICLGKNLGWMAFRKIVPSLLLHLDFQAPEPTSKWTLDCSAGIHTHNVVARIRKRVN